LSMVNGDSTSRRSKLQICLTVRRIDKHWNKWFCHRCMAAHIYAYRDHNKNRAGGMVRVPAQTQQVGQVEDPSMGSYQTGSRRRRKRSAELQALRAFDPMEQKLRTLLRTALKEATFKATCTVITLHLLTS
jgi:hypothetical protein